MTYKAAIVSGLDEYLTILRRNLDGLTPDELRWQAGPNANHITWILWHMSRVEDAWMSRLAESDSVWVSGDWVSKIGVGDADATGGGWSIEQVVAMPEVSTDLLLDYYSAVRERTLQILDGLSDDDLQIEHQHPRMGTVTNAWILGHILVEESQHLGQIGFIRGLLGH